MPILGDSVKGDDPGHTRATNDLLPPDFSTLMVPPLAFTAPGFPEACGLDLECRNAPYCPSPRDKALRDTLRLQGQFAGEKTGSYPTAGDAVGDFLDGMDHKPKVISFGERHPTPGAHESGVRTSAARFADEIMPALCERGYCDFVIEYLPFMIPSLQEELEYYFAGGELFTEETPALTATVIAQGPDFTHILEKARELRQEGWPVNLHGGHLTIEGFLAYMTALRSGRLTINEEWDAYAQVGHNTAMQVLLLFRRGVDRVVTYGGSLHVDPRYDRDMERFVSRNNIDPDVAEARLIPHHLELFSFMLNMPADYATVELVLPDYRPFLDCTDIRYMRLICCGEKEATTLVEGPDPAEYPSASIVFPEIDQGK